ncbi:MAG: hypothetical protein ACTSVO_08605 [Candidatus Heimdallarchaeaceae archaeon]
MKKNYKIPIFVLSIFLMIMLTMFLIINYLPYHAQVDSIIVESVVLEDNGMDFFYYCNVTISLTSWSCCDSVQNINVDVKGNFRRVSISVSMELNACLLQALYTSTLTLPIILTYYGNWTIACNGFTIQLDMGDYLQT